MSRTQENEALRGLLSEIVEERAATLSEAESDALFARIEAAIDAPAIAETEPGAADQSESAIEETPRRGLRLLRGGGAGVLGGVLAAAAALFFVLRPGVAPAPEAPRGSEIVEVDFGMNAGTHFSVEGEQGEQLAVVWIDEMEGY